jgi:hypothetical protein
VPAHISAIRGLYGSASGYTIAAVDAWTFIWLMFLLKIPIVGLFLIVRWAVRATPEGQTGQDGGIGPLPRPLHPHRAGGGRPQLPRRPRRGPHGERSPAAPARVRGVTARRRVARG